MKELAFPRIHVSGTAIERGRQYGEKAAQRIKRSIQNYQQIFEHYAGWDWDRVTQYARAFEPVIESYRSHFVSEMRSMAEGAQVNFEDILALNVRTEVMFAAVARAAAQECSAFVALPAATSSGHTLIGQNWDWKPSTSEAVVILEAEPDEGPRFVTVVEAGLLAKTGFNSAGIGLTTNALVSNEDKGELAVPYHAVLRAILESETMSTALTAITLRRRASSANYLIAHREGEAIDAEAAPGDHSRVHFEFPSNDVYTHTNHFQHPRFDLKDVGLWDGTGSLFRARRLARSMQQSHGAVDLDLLQAALADHFNFPNSICSHPDAKLPPAARYTTVTSVIMDLATSTMWVTDGTPCETPYHEIDYRSLLE